MYVYIRARHEKLWVVGFYKPDGEWMAESDHDSSDEAAKRVHWLNGGHDDEIEELRNRVEVLENPSEYDALMIGEKIERARRR